MSNLKSRFPSIIPMEKIRVGPESHTYEVIEYDDGPNAIKSTYVPDKAPILELETVSGVVDGELYEFVEGVDFDVIDENNDGRLDTIDFGIGGESPDDNTEFEITYIARSVISRYVGSFGDELDRIEEDLDDVISSHYVDEATSTGYIDNFEDEEIVEYIVDYCAGSVGVQSGVVLDGSWALKMTNECINDPLTITSTSGLPRYPQRGDTVVYYMQLTNDGDIGNFDFMYDSSAGGRYYSTELNSETDELIIKKNDGSVKSDAGAVDLGARLGQWLQVRVTIDPIGDITATLFGPNGTELTTASITDTQYESGGIRWRAFNGSGTGIVYADSADIIQRQSSDLDRVGAFFGELGRRRGRTDDEYATFLRSIVQSFSGRGTVDGIKFAVSSALDLDPDQIVIDENFIDNEYNVNIVTPFPPHELKTITDLADLADPSGVRFASINYDIADEQIGLQDEVNISEGVSLDDDMSVDDAAAVNQNVRSTDDDMLVDDAAAVNQNVRSTDDDMLVDDAVSVTINVETSRWNQQNTNWNFFEWQQIEDLVTALSEQSGVADASTIDDNLFTVADEAASNDAVFIDQNTVAAPSDSMSANDAVGINSNRTSTNDVAGTSETVSISTTLVSWESANWGSMEWAAEHN